MRCEHCEYHEANAMGTDHDVILVLEGSFCLSSQEPFVREEKRCSFPRVLLSMRIQS